jgi:hypothetical protein
MPNKMSVVNGLEIQRDAGQNSFLGFDADSGLFGQILGNF